MSLCYVSVCCMSAFLGGCVVLQQTPNTCTHTTHTHIKQTHNTRTHATHIHITQTPNIRTHTESESVV